MEATDDVEQADVVVLNTCCIRENADNKLYGNLGHLKSRQGAAARACRSRWAAAWPRRTASSSSSGRRTSTWCSAPTTWRTRSTCCGAPSCEGPVTEILEESGGLPLRAAGAARPAVLGLGHHPDRLRQPLRVLHRARGAGRGDQPAVRRDRRRGRGARGRRHGRDHAARAERQLLRPRPHQAAAPVRRPAPRGRRGRRHPPGPLHQPAPEGPAARDDRGDGRDAGGLRAPPPAAAGRQRPHAGGHAPRLHRRALPREAGRAPAAEIDDLAVTTDLIVGFPGETDDDFERTLEVVAEAEYDSAYTFIFSPRPGTEAAAHDRPASCRADVAAERFERLPVVVERSAARQAPRRGSAAPRRCSSRARARRTRRSSRGRTRQNKLVHFSTGDGAAGTPSGAASPRVTRITGAAAHFLRGELVEVTGPPRHRTRIPLAVG